MKKTKEIKGLKVISISDGSEVGNVQDIIINAEKGAVDFVIVNCGEKILGAKVISAEKIIGIGEYALTIENEDSIIDISKAPAAIELKQKNVLVVSTKVLTKKGTLIGETGDILIDEDNDCIIIGLEFIGDNEPENVKIIPREKVVTFGQKLIIVEDDVKQNFVQIPQQILIDNEDQITVSSIIELPKNYQNHDEIEDVSLNQEEDIQESKKVIASPVERNGEVNDVFGNGLINKVHSKKEDVGEKGSVALFEQRQRQYLKGKVVTKEITDKNGELIINQGSVIDDVIIDLAKNNGKLIELVMNNKS